MKTNLEKIVKNLLDKATEIDHKFTRGITGKIGEHTFSIKPQLMSGYRLGMDILINGRPHCYNNQATQDELNNIDLYAWKAEQKLNAESNVAHMALCKKLTKKTPKKK